MRTIKVYFSYVFLSILLGTTCGQNTNELINKRQCMKPFMLFKNDTVVGEGERIGLGSVTNCKEFIDALDGPFLSNFNLNESIIVIFDIENFSRSTILEYKQTELLDMIKSTITSTSLYIYTMAIGDCHRSVKLLMSHINSRNNVEKKEHCHTIESLSDLDAYIKDHQEALNSKKETKTRSTIPQILLIKVKDGSMAGKIYGILENYHKSIPNISKYTIITSSTPCPGVEMLYQSPEMLRNPMSIVKLANIDKKDDNKKFFDTYDVFNDGLFSVMFVSVSVFIPLYIGVRALISIRTP